MEQLTLLLSCHSLTIIGSIAKTLERDCAFHPFITVTEKSDWILEHRTSLPPLTDAKRLSQFFLDEKKYRCTFSRQENGSLSIHNSSYQFDIHDTADESLVVRLVYSAGSTTALMSGNPNEFVLRFTIWFAVSLLGAPCHVSFVHSSTIVYNNHAILFLGESGTGKSTHSQLWLNHIEGSRLLNDDSPMITIEKGLPMVYGSPWSGKKPCYIPRQYPIGAIVRIVQAKHNHIERLNTTASFAALQPSLPPALMQDQYFSDLLIQLISKILSHTPCYCLECLPNSDAAHVCHDFVC